MFFLTPRYVKQGRNFVKDARKLLAYKRDLLDAKTSADFEAGIQKLEQAVKDRDGQEIERTAKDLDKQCSAFVTPPKDQGWRENCEVFLVAIVVALGVRTYFLQPFTIPTGSMFPTLNGIIGTKTDNPPPNLLVRIAQLAWFGRTWVNVVTDTDDVIRDAREVKTLPFTNWQSPLKLLNFGTRTELIGQQNRYVVDCPKDTLNSLIQRFGVCKAGDIIARGYYETGDHVFVDKLTYHFRKPQRGEVFVFNTQRIPTRENVAQGMNGPSQFYIKRLAGTPEDVLQVRPPELFINGKRAEGFGFERVMASQGEYHGYSNGAERIGPNGPYVDPMKLLRSPDEVWRIHPRSYFAMGDNSYHSSDSRDWGEVPQENIMGRGVFVYWPFTRHFGLIR